MISEQAINYSRQSIIARFEFQSNLGININSPVFLNKIILLV